MTQPVLETERLLLRPRRPEDLEACYAMNMEPGTLDFVAFPRAGSWDDEATHRAYLAETFVYRHSDGLGYWSVVPRDDPGTFLGWVLMAPEDLQGPEVEIGRRFRRAVRRRDYATEAARALVAHGFDTLALPCVIAEVALANAGSMGVARKLGMRVRPDAGPLPVGSVMWELTAGMWASTPR